MNVTTARVKNVLTRASGYLRPVCSHSLQPYRGCGFGRALCGVGCYVRHNTWLTRGEEWGSFLEVRENAAEAYAGAVDRERAWARRSRGAFTIFLSSSTDPFPPHEARFGVTRRVLEAMLVSPPDELIVQTHSPAVAGALDLLVPLRTRAGARVRVHLSIESDRDRLEGLPPPAATVDARLAAAAACRAAGLPTVVTVSPLLPIADPERFFARIGEVADAVVLDHYVGGDGSRNGARTERTGLPAAIAAVEVAALDLAYRDRMVEVARRHLPRVGVSAEGFAGRFL